jgi:hypothetical protein
LGVSVVHRRKGVELIDQPGISQDLGIGLSVLVLHISASPPDNPYLQFTLSCGIPNLELHHPVLEPAFYTVSLLSCACQ